MNRKLGSLVIAVVLILVTVACGISGKSGGTGGEEVQDTVAPTDIPVQPTNTPQPTPTDVPEPTDTPEPAVEPDVELGEVYRSEEGGYEFQAIQGYTIDEFFGIASMEAPDADPEAGPSIFIMGGLNEGESTAQQLYDDLVNDIDEDIHLSEPREVVVGGVTGLVADVDGTLEGKDVAGRVVLVAVTPQQMFTMIGAAPVDRWGSELEPLYQAVLASITFFEPVVELDPDVEPTKEVAGIEGVEHQWASTATASSEYSNPEWSAMQATGQSDTLECGDYATAWASANANTVEWIELGYDCPVLPTEVNIIQTYTPNQVVKVELLDLEGNYYTIYTGTPQDESDNCPFVLHIPVEGINRQVEGVKITLDQSVIGYWNEIDAVELVGVPEHPVMMGESAYLPGHAAPGSFIFEVIGAGEDAVIDGGIVMDNSSYNEYGVAFVQEGALARYSLTLYLLHDVAPGVIELKPYDKSASPRGPSAAVAIGVWFYYVTEGTLTVYDVSDGATSNGVITGDFYFQAAHEEDATKTVTVMGAFNQVPLVKK